ALRDVADRHAGVERREKMFLRIGEPVAPAELQRLVDVDGESARHAFAADVESLDLRAAARLALPARRDAPVRLAFCGIPLDGIDERKKIIDIDAVDYLGNGGLGLSDHGRCPCA